MTTATVIRADERPEEVTPIGAPGLMLGGKYELEEPIARGGMARVWRARHVTLNRPVAVKFVEGAGAGKERIERFLREAKVAASVRHKNVVDILDFGVLDLLDREPEPYMVMELLEGETLADLVSRGPVDVHELVSIALQLLSGLDAVHRAGIVHRDLKPGNVFLTHDHDGTFARVLDFGISQETDEAETSSALIVGTPEYMSPEQAMGAPLDARADLYSIGVILYEMLSGRVPFEHEDGQRVLEMLMTDVPTPVIKLRPDAPELCAVVDTAMARAPESRFTSAREMRRAVLEAAGIPETTDRSSLSHELRPSGTRRREDLITMPELLPAPEPSEAAAEAAPVRTTSVPPAATPVEPVPSVKAADRRWMGMAAVGAALAIGVGTWAAQVEPAARSIESPSIGAPSPAIASPASAASTASTGSTSEPVADIEPAPMIVPSVSPEAGPEDEAAEAAAPEIAAPEAAAADTEASLTRESTGDESTGDESTGERPALRGRRGRRGTATVADTAIEAAPEPTEAPAEAVREEPRTVVPELDF
jgi:serine/threonine protein kinase